MFFSPFSFPVIALSFILFRLRSDKFLLLTPEAEEQRCADITFRHPCPVRVVRSFVRSFVHLLNNKANRNIYSSQHTQSKTTRLIRVLMATLIIGLQYVVIMTFPTILCSKKNLKHTLKIHIKTL